MTNQYDSNKFFQSFHILLAEKLEDVKNHVFSYGSCFYDHHTQIVSYDEETKTFGITVERLVNYHYEKNDEVIEISEDSMVEMLAYAAIARMFGK